MLKLTFLFLIVFIKIFFDIFSNKYLYSSEQISNLKKYRRRQRKRGRGIPYVSGNKVYFGKGIPPRHLLTGSYLGRRKVTGSGAITKILAKALQGVGDLIGV